MRTLCVCLCPFAFHPPPPACQLRAARAPCIAPIGRRLETTRHSAAWEPLATRAPLGRRSGEPLARHSRRSGARHSGAARAPSRASLGPRCGATQHAGAALAPAAQRRSGAARREPPTCRSSTARTPLARCRAALACWSRAVCAPLGCRSAAARVRHGAARAALGRHVPLGICAENSRAGTTIKLDRRPWRPGAQ